MRTITKLKIVDWDIQIDRHFMQPYLGSHKLCHDEEGNDCWGRDLYFQFLGLHLYLAIEWR